MLARYTTDWDCPTETNWWYVIKDTPFDISQLKAKRRYEINKGFKHFYVKRIEPRDFKEAMCDVQMAALVAFMLEDQRDFLRAGNYICDGARSVLHETAFQDYLEKYFGFRKAYCRLRIVYRPGIFCVVKMLYPFRRFLRLLSNNRLINKICAVLTMEEICRESRAK